MVLRTAVPLFCVSVIAVTLGGTINVCINYFPNNLQLLLQLPSSNDPTDDMDSIKMKRFFPPYFNDEQEHNQDFYFLI